MTDSTPGKDPFVDASLASYEADLNQGLSLSGEGKDFFAQGRLDLVARRLKELGREAPRTILDYGCGLGNATVALSQLWPQARVIGVDTSDSLISTARGNASDNPHCQFHTPETLPEDLRFDLVYCNGVFHHIPVAERSSVLAWIHARMTPGGLFSLWENNSWNPGTRWVMRRIPFDRDAILLSPLNSRRMLKHAGYHLLGYDFAFIFPKFMSGLRPLERCLCKLPLGAQYQILSQRSPAPES